MIQPRNTSIDPGPDLCRVDEIIAAPSWGRLSKQDHKPLGSESSTISAAVAQTRRPLADQVELLEGVGGPHLNFTPRPANHSNHALDRAV